MISQRARSTFAIIVWIACTSCGGDGANGTTADSSRDSSTAVAPQPAAPDSAISGAHRPEDLVSAAEAVIAFLRGEGAFDRLRLSDTVALYLSPGGGGTRRDVPRDALRLPANWRVGSHSFVPPAGRAELTTRVGRHLNCRETELSGELAHLPHVGTMLRYGESCLQTRNLTLVFDPNRTPPTLIAAVYDQWEW